VLFKLLQKFPARLESTISRVAIIETSFRMRHVHSSKNAF